MNLNRLYDRLDRLQSRASGPEFILEIADHSQLDTALANWRRHHRTDPALILILPKNSRRYEPAYPTA